LYKDRLLFAYGSRSDRKERKDTDERRLIKFRTALEYRFVFLTALLLYCFTAAHERHDARPECASTEWPYSKSLPLIHFIAMS
jgi:hypothetical protein